MSENNQTQFKKIFSIALILLLFLLVSAQAWYNFDLKKQLDQINKQQSTIQSQLQAQTQAQTQTKTHTRAQETTLNDKDIAERVDAEEPLKSADKQQPVLQENQPTQSAQRQNRNVTPDDAAPFYYDDDFYRPFDVPQWDPYAEIERMQRDMDRMFYRHFNQFQNAPDFHRHFRQSTSTPEIDVKENEHQYMVLVNLPGTDENDISVTLDGQRLTIKGKQDYKKQNKDPMGNIIFQERRSGRFQRSITLPSPVRQKGMKTRLENGVLKIIIPKNKNAQRR